MLAATRALERALLVTGKHQGFVRRHLDQVHFTAARRTFQPGAPFSFHSELSPVLAMGRELQNLPGVST
jgi:hypothetical protein